MGKIKNILTSSIFIGLIFTAVSFGKDAGEIKEKSPKIEQLGKVLFLEIVEENWDNLKFWPPKRDLASPYKLPTKKQVIERKVKKWEKVRAKDYMLENLKKHLMPSDVKLVIHHQIKYFGKIEEYKDNDIFDDDEYRFGDDYFNYSYKQIPETISLLTDPIKTRSLWRTQKLEHIRLVEDITILSSDAMGNLKMKYNNKTYRVKIGDKIVFSTKTANLTEKEIIRYKEKYRKEIGSNADQLYDGVGIIVDKKVTYQFKTKITIINYGYITTEL